MFSRSDLAITPDSMVQVPVIYGCISLGTSAAVQLKATLIRRNFYSMVAPKEGDSAISAAHHEVSGTGQPSQPEVHSLIAAFEERKIDLRTILGIAV